MIFSAFERMVAMRYLRARRQEGYISVIAGFSFLGIALGVAVLIVVMSVMNGFRHELLGQIMGINAHAVVAAPKGPLRDYQPVADRLRQAEGVTLVMPVLEAQALVRANGRATGALVRGIEPGAFARRPVVGQSIFSGLPDVPPGGVAIGAGLARALGVGVGTELTVISPRGTPTPFGTVPRSRTAVVTAVFDVQMSELDQSMMYMDLEEAQTFFRLPGAVTHIDVFVAQPNDVDAFRATVGPAAGPDLRLTDWRQANASYVTALAVERVAMFIVLTLIILVATFNIVSSMIMLVRDKGANIAIMRTMGATSGMMLRVFLLAGASIGVVGTLAGFGLGVAVADNIQAVGAWLSWVSSLGTATPGVSFFSRLTAIIDWGEVALVVGMGLTLSIGATLYPAWRAARLDPVEALRYG